jgi:L-cystine uptake protein TcyP (sodium:dicarboxylate symporter family)
MNKIQFIKLILLVLVFTMIAYAGIFIEKNLSIQTIMLLDTSTPYIFGITATAAFYILKHMDGIATSTSAIKNSKNKEKIKKLQQSYQHLSQEAISNIILSLALFVLAKTVKSPNIDLELSQLQVGVVSLKFSCFGTMLYIAFDQIRSLHTVMQYRRIIEVNKK